MEVFTQDRSGSVMARRLLPVILPIPLFVGWLRVYGERIGAFESYVGVTLVALTYTVCLLGLVWLSARSENRKDEALRLAMAEQKRAEEALRDADRRKDEFLAILSHELRNPLTPIRNSLYILDQVEPGGEQAVRAKAVVERQVKHLSRLVDDLLDLTRISRGKIHIQRDIVDLTALMRRVVEDHRSMFIAAGVELETNFTDRSLWVSADAARISQAVGNLIRNAVKFTKKGDLVTVSLEQDLDRDIAQIRVSDTGIGISADVIPRLFQPFEQADSSIERTRGGLGLGLALVKRLVELHEGEVSVRSDGLGTGAEFTIRLPLAKKEAAAAAVLGKEPGGASKRVLVIEDNVDAAQSLRESLELSRHQVEVAYNAPEGIEKARIFKPDVVLCDIGLPEMSGYQLAKVFRGDQTLCSIYLVALSGYALPENVAESMAAGFDEHLAKPPDMRKLIDMLAKAPAVKSGSG